MPNDIETPEKELIQKAKESLAGIQIIPGCSFGDSTIFSDDFDNNTIYFVVINSFQDIIILHPSTQVTHSVEAIIPARINTLNDHQNPVVTAVGNTKQN